MLSIYAMHALLRFVFYLPFFSCDGFFLGSNLCVKLILCVLKNVFQKKKERIRISTKCRVGKSFIRESLVLQLFLGLDL